MYIYMQNNIQESTKKLPGWIIFSSKICRRPYLQNKEKISLCLTVIMLNVYKKRYLININSVFPKKKARNNRSVFDQLGKIGVKTKRSVRSNQDESIYFFIVGSLFFNRTCT